MSICFYNGVVENDDLFSLFTTNRKLPMATDIRSEFSDCQWYQWQPMVPMVKLPMVPLVKLRTHGILVGWGRIFFVCCLAHRGSTVGFLLLQWCCSIPQGSPGVGSNTLFLSSPHLCFIIVFICDLFVSCDDPLMS